MPRPDPTKFHLPEHAQCVFVGEMCQVWQWQQELYDGSTSTFEAVLYKSSASTIATVGDKIMLVRDTQPGQKTKIALPGGRADTWSEEPLATAQRELLEEAGLQSGDWHPFWEMETTHVNRRKFTDFIARDCRQVAEPATGAGEKVEPFLVTFEQFLEMADDPNFRDRELVPILLRAKYDETERAKLHRQIFGK